MVLDLRSGAQLFDSNTVFMSWQHDGNGWMQQNRPEYVTGDRRLG